MGESENSSPPKSLRERLGLDPAKDTGEYTRLTRVQEQVDANSGVQSELQVRANTEFRQMIAERAAREGITVEALEEEIRNSKK
ncbi:MAG: hypothetical protein M3Q44_04445 [bacterium]|nr:hypothetical protein [bacterium]